MFFESPETGPALDVMTYSFSVQSFAVLLRLKRLRSHLPACVLHTQQKLA